MNLISNEYSNKLGNSSKKQLSMKCFLILDFATCNTETTSLSYKLLSY